MERRYRRVLQVFIRAGDELKLNQGVSVLATGGHSYAETHLRLLAGTDGEAHIHRQPAYGAQRSEMTSRYAHLASDTQRAAAMELEGHIGRELRPGDPPYSLAAFQFKVLGKRFDFSCP